MSPTDSGDGLRDSHRRFQSLAPRSGDLSNPTVWLLIPSLGNLRNSKGELAPPLTDVSPPGSPVLCWDVSVLPPSLRE